MKTFLAALSTLIIIVFPASGLLCHCEIPCGIYNDELRIFIIEEHVDTIEKSMKMILKLKEEGNLNYNQIVRWINNKEYHAESIQEIVQRYFMTQRIKPAAREDETAYKDYIEKLALMHEMLIYAMKAKQSVDTGNVEKLREILKNFKALYFNE
ncbi:MAG: superoxide dismutase [Thermoplasmata archaeon]|nr:MAG: superoxide dismutase [Thermoplasmata archaeon]